MSLDINDVQFLLQARKQGVDFGDVLMIGRQNLNVYPGKMRQVLSKGGFPTERFAEDAAETGYSEPVFLSMGARQVSSMDASSFEGAEFVHDLNQPVNDALKQKFDLVYDGGTLEHVFNFPTALRNCMEMVRLDGRFISHTPTNNWCGHGFFQFSPELFYNVLCEDNGFEVERMVVHVVGPYGRWYEVTNPQAIRSRVEFFNSFPLLILLQARRKAIVPLFRKMPQQSDYTPRWEGQAKTSPPPPPASPKLVQILPGIARLANVAKNGWRVWRGHSLSNRRNFKPISKS